MPPSHFHLPRLTAELIREIGIVIAQEMRDPRIPPMVTVTRLKLAQDTRNATVFVSIFGSDDEGNEAVVALNKAAPFIQRQVAQRVTVRHFPQLVFKLDHSFEHAEHINELLKEVKDDLV